MKRNGKIHTPLVILVIQDPLYRPAMAAICIAVGRGVKADSNGIEEGRMSHGVGASFYEDAIEHSNGSYYSGGPERAGTICQI